MNRIPLIDLVRGLCLLSVLADHFPPIFYSLPEPFRTAWAQLARNGIYGVSLFFVLSGFVITRLLAQSENGLFSPNRREFYGRRGARICPLLFATIAIGLIALYTLRAPTERFSLCFQTTGVHFRAGFWISLFTFSFNWVRVLSESAIAGFGMHWDSLWSLAVEEQFYLLFPFLLLAARNRKHLVVILLAIVALGPATRFWTSHFYPHRFLLGYMQSFAVFDQVAVGALLFLTLERWEGFLRPRKRLCQALAGVGALTILGGYGLTDVFAASDRIFTPSILALGLALFLAGGLNLRLVENRNLLVRFGRVSYGGYLLHPLVLYLLWDVLSVSGFWMGFPLFVAGTFLVALLSFYFFETPASRGIRRHFVNASSPSLPPLASPSVLR